MLPRRGRKRTLVDVKEKGVKKTNRRKDSWSPSVVQTKGKNRPRANKNAKPGREKEKLSPTREGLKPRVEPIYEGVLLNSILQKGK